MTAPNFEGQSALHITPTGATDVVIVGPPALAAWRELHSLHYPGYEFMPQFQSGQWDGIWRPGRLRIIDSETVELRCSQGLAYRIMRDLAPGMPTPSYHLFPDDIAFIELHARHLREHQANALRLALAWRWGRVALATNAGKGAVMAIMAAWARRKKMMNVLVLCDTISVFDALAEELKKWGGKGLGLSFVQAGSKHPVQRPVTLAMVPTLARRLMIGKARSEWRQWMAYKDMVLIDEADRCTDSEQWRMVLAAATGSTYRVGFSGTFPEDMFSNLRLDDLMGPIIARTGNAELVAQGVSAKPTIELAGFDATASLRALKIPDWNGAALRGWVFDHAILSNVARHRFVASLVRPGVPTAIIVNRVQHGHALAAYIPGSVYLDGSKDAATRRLVLDDFENGRFTVLIVTKILDRGTNRLGSAQDLIFASGEGSKSQTLQRLGRGLRRKDGKAELRLVDVIDRVEILPHDRYDWQTAVEFIHSMGRQRIAVYAEEGFDVTATR